MARKLLRVFPNPYRSVDHLGRPCFALAAEPIGNGVTTFDDRRWIGATLEATLKRKFPQGTSQQDEYDHVWNFQAEPVVLESTEFYKKALRQHELVAADEETAKIAGIPFRDPGEYLELQKEWAAQHLTDVHAHEEHDEDTLATLLAHSFGPMPSAQKKALPAHRDEGEVR